MRKTMTPKALQSLLSGHPRLAAISKAAHRQPVKEATDPATILPPALRQRVTLIEDEQRWLAIADTSATAQLLRFHLPRLQQALPGQQIKIVVGGKRQQADPQRHRAAEQGATLSRQSAEHIQQLAENIDDAPLKAALQRLASRSSEN